jgi:hypothetical protein
MYQPTPSPVGTEEGNPVSGQKIEIERTGTRHTPTRNIFKAEIFDHQVEMGYRITRETGVEGKWQIQNNKEPAFGNLLRPRQLTRNFE